MWVCVLYIRTFCSVCNALTFSAIFKLIRNSPFINGGGNRSTRQKPRPDPKSLATFSSSDHREILLIVTLFWHINAYLRLQRKKLMGPYGPVTLTDPLGLRTRYGPVKTGPYGPVKMTGPLRVFKT